MKNPLLVFAFVASVTFTSCKNDDVMVIPEEMAETLPEFSRVDEVVTYNQHISKDSTVIRMREFRLKDGLVTSIGDSTLFLYNDNQRLVSMVSNEVEYQFVWIGDTCRVIYPNPDVIDKLIYEDCNLESNSYIVENSQSSERTYIYDGNENLIKLYHGVDLQSTYVGYDTSAIHPYYYLKSIEPWITAITALPVSKNIPTIRKDEEVQEDDFYLPPSDYQYDYKIRDPYRVVAVSPEWSIYTWHYKFYE